MPDYTTYTDEDLEIAISDANNTYVMEAMDERQRRDMNIEKDAFVAYKDANSRSIVKYLATSYGGAYYLFDSYETALAKVTVDTKLCLCLQETVG